MKETTQSEQIWLLTGDRRTADLVLSAAAALQLQPEVTADPAALAAAWRSAGTVFVGADFAGDLAALALPARSRVYLVGSDAAELGLWSMPLAAEVILLPEGRAWLSSVLTSGSARGRSPVVAVLGGSGGVGASTLAAGVACRAARRGVSVALVDVDPAGGGIDLLLGAERVPGWRWPRLSGAEGFLGDLREHLPEVDGVSLVAMARGPALDVAREPLAAVIGSLQRSFGLVVIDAGRGQTGAARESLRLATRVLLVVGTALRSVAAARQLARGLELRDPDLVIRALPGGTVPSDVVADALGARSAVRVADDPRARVAAERGEPPARSARRGLGRGCEQVLDAVLEAS